MVTFCAGGIAHRASTFLNAGSAGKFVTGCWNGLDRLVIASCAGERFASCLGTGGSFGYCRGVGVLAVDWDFFRGLRLIADGTHCSKDAFFCAAGFLGDSCFR